MDEAAHTKVVEECQAILERERQRATELIKLMNEETEKNAFEQKEPVVRAIGNKVLHSCGDETGIVGLPKLLDHLYPPSAQAIIGTDLVLPEHVGHQEIGASPIELFSIAKTLTRAYLKLTDRINIAYQLDLVSKGYTAEEADDLAFYLSRKETYFPWYKTRGTHLRRFVTVFDILDVSGEDVGMSSEVIHSDLARFFQIWYRYVDRRSRDSLVRSIISERWSDHGQMGLVYNRLSPAEIDMTIASYLKPDGTALDDTTAQMIRQKFGTLFDGNILRRIQSEQDVNEDVVRARQVRFTRHAGHLNPTPNPLFWSLMWGAT